MNFMPDLHEAIITAIDKVTAPYSDASDDAIMAAVLTVLSNVSASVAIAYGLDERAFAVGMALSYKKTQQYEAGLQAADAIDKAARG